jgi:ribonuclease P protein component
VSADAVAGFGKSLRLRTAREFDRVQRGGARISGRHLVIVHAANDLGTPRFGLAVSRKVGGAVVRNRVKRWIREAARLGRVGLGGRDVVVIARTGSGLAGFLGIRDELWRALDALRVLSPATGA